MGAQNISCIALSLSACSLVAWGIGEPVFEFVCGCRGDGEASCQMWRCSMRECGMSGSGGIGMFTLDVLYRGDGNLVGCCDECVGGVGRDDDNYRVGFDDGDVDVTDECGYDGGVVGFLEGRNIGNVEGYIRGVSGG